MYYIKMNDDKTLITTVPTKIYQGDNCADEFVFLLPQSYDSIVFADHMVYLRYVLPSGDGASVSLKKLDELYSGYLQYVIDAKAEMTKTAGMIEMWITVLDAKKAAVLNTSSLRVRVFPKTNIVDHMPNGMNQLDWMAIQIARLDDEKADNIITDVDDKGDYIQLTANDARIGNQVYITGAGSGGDGDDYWEDMDGDGQPDVPGDDTPDTPVTPPPSGGDDDADTGDGDIYWEPM